MLSPFRSPVASKERAHRLITSIFELELDSQRRSETKIRAGSIPSQSHNLSLGQVRKKFTVKDLAYDYKKVN